MVQDLSRIKTHGCSIPQNVTALQHRHAQVEGEMEMEIPGQIQAEGRGISWTIGDSA
jgi:hypothetical protein